MKHLRIDASVLRTAVKTANGFLRAPCLATRSGIFVYRNADGSTRKELRPASEVFHSDSLASLAGVPITDEHPKDLLNPENVREHQRGITGDTIEQEGNYIRCSLTVTDSALMSDLWSKKRTQVSCGYTCDIDDTPGEFEGERYDSIQKNIVYNHLAIVSSGRAGPLASVKFDASEYDVSVQEVVLPQEQIMAKIRIDEVDLEVSETVAVALTAKLESLKTELQKLSDEIENLKGQGAAKDIAIDAANKKMDSLDIHKLVQDRMSLISKAEPFLKGTKFDSLSDREIKLEVIKTKAPEVKTDEADAYINGLFDGLTQQTTKLDALADTLNKSRAAGVHLTSDDARKRSMEADKNLWKKTK